MISNKCHYALRAMLELALHEGRGPVTIGDIATPSTFRSASWRRSCASSSRPAWPTPCAARKGATSWPARRTRSRWARSCGCSRAPSSRPSCRRGAPHGPRERPARCVRRSVERGATGALNSGIRPPHATRTSPSPPASAWRMRWYWTCSWSIRPDARGVRAGHRPAQPRDLRMRRGAAPPVRGEDRMVFPRHEAVEDLERAKGLFSFRESVENRKECCGIRKVEPLNRALSGLQAWITGLRREQSVTRTELAVVEPTPPTAASARSTRWPTGRWTICGPTRARRKSPITGSTIRATPPSAAPPAPAPSSRAKTSAPAAGGGRTPNTRNAGCT
jgi:hypothetical protein